MSMLVYSKWFHSSTVSIGLEEGFSLLEVLITMLLIIVGLLGVAGLQSTTLRQGNNMHFDSLANVMSQALMEQVMAHETVDGSGIFASTVVPVTLDNDCSIVVCTRAQMVTDLMWHWDQNLKAAFPSSDYDLVYDQGTASYSLNITWDDDGDGTVSPAQIANCNNNLALGRGSYCLMFRTR